MIAKLIAHGSTREEAIARLLRALDLFVVEGIHTSIPLHQRILKDQAFRDAEIDTHYIQRFLEKTKKAVYEDE
jgi:acetyl-CoA carboxylase biotin carboxylase subunit